MIEDYITSEFFIQVYALSLTVADIPQPLQFPIIWRRIGDPVYWTEQNQYAVLVEMVDSSSENGRMTFVITREHEFKFKPYMPTE
jgi:hypothetical protein